jgi:multidrug efflux pump subunit AcrA (membrane-fusion protein)
VVSHAALRAEGNGILLTPLGVADIHAPAPGRVAELKVKPGQKVTAGELIAILSQDDLAARLAQKQLEWEKIHDQENLVRKFYEADKAQRSKLIATQEENLKYRIQVLAELEKSVADQGDIQQTLLGRGLTVQEKLLTARSRLKEIQSEASEARILLTRLQTDEAQQQSRVARELLDSRQGAVPWNETL